MTTTSTTPPTSYCGSQPSKWTHRVLSCQFYENLFWRAVHPKTPRKSLCIPYKINRKKCKTMWACFCLSRSNGKALWFILLRRNALWLCRLLLNECYTWFIVYNALLCLHFGPVQVHLPVHSYQVMFADLCTFKSGFTNKINEHSNCLHGGLQPWNLFFKLKNPSHFFYYMKNIQ